MTLGDDQEVPAASAQANPRPVALTAAVVLATAQSIAVLAYAVAILVSALAPGGGEAAAPVEIAIYVVFALGIALVARGLRVGRRVARAPFALIQAFGLITGWTLVQGDGTTTHVIGWVVLVVSVVGIALILNRDVGSALAD